MYISSELMRMTTFSGRKQITTNNRLSFCHVPFYASWRNTLPNVCRQNPPQLICRFSMFETLKVSPQHGQMHDFTVVQSHPRRFEARPEAAHLSFVFVFGTYWMDQQKRSGLLCRSGFQEKFLWTVWLQLPRERAANISEPFLKPTGSEYLIFFERFL